MASLLRRASHRYLLRHPWQFGLSVLGVALGVAVFVSVDLANGSARRSFEISTEAVTGRATHQIVAGADAVPESLFRQLRVDLGVREAAPVVEGWAGRVDRPGAALRILGVDPFSEAAVRPYLSGRGGGPGAVDVGSLLTDPAAGVLTPETARDLGVEPGADVALLVNGEARTLRVAGYLEPERSLWSVGLRDVVVMDIAAAQELLGLEGRLSRVDLVLATEREAERLRRALPATVSLVSAAQRADTMMQMTRAFRLNLQAMSLLALVCGMFLIYNTTTFSVVQRRGLLGRLRAVGVTRREVLALVLGEAFVVGVVGTALGLIGGVALGSTLVRLVTRTINDLYYVVAVRELAVSPASLCAGLLLGVGATMLAALAPAREAARTTPRASMLRSDLESRARGLVPTATALGVALMLLGAAVLAWPSGSLLLAFLGLFGTVLGAALMTPAATLLLAGMAREPLRRALGVLGTMAARGVAANLSRTAVAVAALMISVSVIVGVGVMVASFRATLEGWLEHTLEADLYVSPVDVPRGAATLELSSGSREALRNDIGVERFHTIRAVHLETLAGPTLLLALDAGEGAATAYRLLAGEPREAWARLLAGDVWVSEPYAARTGVAVGATIELPTDAGPTGFRVAAVYRSYASDRGAVLMHRSAYDRLWSDRSISGMSVYLRPGADTEQLRGRLRTLLAGGQQIRIVSNGELRAESLAVFDRTFLITGVLRVLVTLVAFVGVLSALMAMTLERARELGVLRAIGMTPRQLRITVTAQTGLLGLIAGVVAVPVGVGLAWVMIHVINRRSFGWSLEMLVPVEILVQAVAIAVVAALLAGLLPARRMAQTVPAAALREE